MRYVHYVTDGGAPDDVQIEGVCHRSKLEYLCEPGAAMHLEVISDEAYDALVDEWGGVVKPKKTVKEPA